MARRSRRNRLDTFPLYLLLFVVLGSLFVVFFPSLNRSEAAIGCGGYVDERKLSEAFDPDAKFGEFLGNSVNVPPYQSKLLANVLGDTTDTNKRIEVDLANQKVYTYDGNSLIQSFTVSTGKWAPTPAGIFTIERKVNSQTMKGGDKAKNTYYYLPNVPNVMYFGNSDIPWWKGYSFHGAYWHNNFGKPMSHGCINMRIKDSETLFGWAPQGTKVYIH